MDCNAAMIAAAQLTKYTVFNTAELTKYTVFNTAQLTDCSWTDKVQGRAAKKVTVFSIADCLAPSQQLADRLTN